MKGRPTDFNDEMSATICQRIIEGESLRAICSDDDMPSRNTVCRWLANDNNFSDQYARARELQQEHHADDLIEIADDARNDWMAAHGGDDEGYRANGENVQRSRLRIDARKWLMSKLAPKKYGERKAVELTGAEGGPVEFTAITRTIVDPSNPSD